MIVLDASSTAAEDVATSPERDVGLRASSGGIHGTNSVARKPPVAVMTASHGQNGLSANQKPHEISHDSRGELNNLRDLLSDFSSATVSMVTLKVQKDFAEQKVHEIESGQVSTVAARVSDTEFSRSSDRNSSPVMQRPLVEAQRKLQDCRNSYQHSERMHAQALQELATEICSSGNRVEKSGSVASLEKRLHEFQLEMRAKDKAIATLTENVLRLESDFAELWGDLGIVKRNLPSSPQQQGRPQDSTEKRNDADQNTLSRLKSIEYKQNQLDEQTNLLREDFEDFRVIETKKFVDVSTLEKLSLRVDDLSSDVRNLETSHNEKLSLLTQDTEDLYDKTVKLTMEHQTIEGKLDLIQNQTKEKEEYHLERVDEMQADLDEIKAEKRKARRGGSNALSATTEQINPQPSLPDPRMNEVLSACVELNRKINELQANTSSSTLQAKRLIEQAQTQNQMNTDVLAQLRSSFERNEQQSEVHTVAIQSLEKRFNNLTTEHMVDLMVKRVRHLYPNIAAAEEKIAGVDRRLKGIEETTKDLTGAAGDEVAKAERNLDRIQRSFADVRTWMDWYDGRLVRLEGSPNAVLPNTVDQHQHHHQHQYQQYHRDSNSNGNNSHDNGNGSNNIAGSGNGFDETYNANALAVRVGYSDRNSISTTSSDAVKTTKNIHSSNIASYDHNNNAQNTAQQVTTETVATLAAQQNRHSAILIRILKSNTALKMAVNALNTHTRLRTVDWEAMEELKDLRGMKGQRA